MANLTAKQKRFCDEYLIDLNATQAAIRTGYSEKTARSQGQRLLTNADIKNYIDSMLEQMHNERTADAQEVMEYLTSVMRKETMSSVLARDVTGAEIVIEKPPDEKECLKAAELLGKAHMIFTDRVDMNADVKPIVIKDDVVE